MDWLDPLLLARWQFGLTTLYHFLFVPLTLGMALVTVPEGLVDRTVFIDHGRIES